MRKVCLSPSVCRLSYNSILYMAQKDQQRAFEKCVVKT